MSERVKVAILGSGNIGTDLMYKLLKNPGHMELVAVVGIDPKSEGLARARALGLEASHEGIAYILERPEIKIVFDATSAKAHVRHAKLLREAGKIAIDLTPAARGPYVVPPVNLKEHLDKDNVNLITCGGRPPSPWSTRCTGWPPCSTRRWSPRWPPLRGPRHPAEHRRVHLHHRPGPGGHRGAKKGKAIIILNPAEPPILMTNTVRCIPEDEGFDREAVVASVRAMEREVQAYVPGYRLKADPVFERLPTPWGSAPWSPCSWRWRGRGTICPNTPATWTS